MGKDDQREIRRLMENITGFNDKELQHEAMKVLLATMSLDKRF